MGKQQTDGIETRDDSALRPGRYKMYLGDELIGEGEVKILNAETIVSAKTLRVGKVYAAEQPANTDRAQLRAWRQERGS